METCKYKKKTEHGKTQELKEHWPFLSFLLEMKQTNRKIKQKTHTIKTKKHKQTHTHATDGGQLFFRVWSRME